MPNPPRPITWWNLGLGCITRFDKTERAPAFIIGDDANNILMVTIPAVLQVPIFELHCGEGGRPIIDQVQERLEALLDAAKFETCTNDTEPAGAFYGLMRSCYRVRGAESDPWMDVVELGLAFSEQVLTPHFGDWPSGDPLSVSFENHEMNPEECQRFGLPFYMEPPEPEVYRPTRFEREDVI